MVVKFVARAARHASVLDLAMQLQTNVRSNRFFISRREMYIRHVTEFARPVVPNTGT